MTRSRTNDLSGKLSGGQAKGRSLLAPACSPTRLSTWAGLLCVFVTLMDSAYEKAVATGTDRGSHKTITRPEVAPLHSGLGFSKVPDNWLDQEFTPEDLERFKKVNDHFCTCPSIRCKLHGEPLPEEEE